MKLRQVIISTFLGIILGSAIGLISSNIAPPARAYNDYHVPCGTWPYGGGTLSRPYAWGGSVWQPYFDNFIYALNAWNGYPPVFWSYDPNQQNTFLDTYSNPNDGNNGFANTGCAIGTSQLVYGDAFLNRFKLDPVGHGLRQRVAMHELGHVLGLGHSVYVPASMYDADLRTRA